MKSEGIEKIDDDDDDDFFWGGGKIQMELIN